MDALLNHIPDKIMAGSSEYYTNMFYQPDSLLDYAVLKIAVNPNNSELVQIYTDAIQKHNDSVRGNIFYNSGFDLFMSKTIQLESDHSKTAFLDLNVKCEMLHCKLFLQNDASHPVAGMSTQSPFYLYPRSSISKTPLMLANHTGIIDTGYRGNIIAAVRCLDSQPYTVEKHSRLFQLCHPSLCPIYVIRVNEYDLSSTERGSGGFGSTGK
jgi:dUTP pyrophosphatase